ncbi:putative RNA recognition motif domain, RNA-binding domain superfamily [Helianthus anomalus]
MLVADFLGYYEEIIETYIARKNDRDGNRFGFVTFKNVKDARVLEHSMNGIKTRRFILKVNITKFAVENASILEVDDQPKNMPFDEPNRKTHMSQNFGPENNSIRHTGGRSFADLFKSEAPQNLHEVSPGKTIVISEDVRAFHYLHGRALVGRTVDLSTLTKMDKFLGDAGYAWEEIHYAGVLFLMLKFSNQEEATGL